MLNKIAVDSASIGPGLSYKGRRCYIFKSHENGITYHLMNYTEGISACVLSKGEFSTIQESIVYHLTHEHKRDDIMKSGDYIIIDDKTYQYEEDPIQ